MLNRKNLKNVIANLAGRFWSIAANLIVVPVYLNFLGLESYGLIALYTSIILAINVADAGLSPSFARDIARADKASDMGNALKTLEIIYLALFIIISAIVLSCSNEISKLLISSSSYSSSQNEIMIIMMVIAASAQLCTVVYRAGYMGLEKYVRVNTYTVGFSITRLFGPVVIFMWSTDLYYYFFYQLIISLMYLLFIRNRYWMEIGNPRCFKFDFVYLAGIKKFAGGLFIVSIMSVITTQLDKFMLSNMLGVKSLSIYSIASGVSMLLYSICLPIVITFYPKLTKLVKNEAFDELSDLYLKVNYFVSVVSISALLTLCYYAYDIILLWTNDAYIAESSSILIPILCTGTFFLCLQLLPYHLGLANAYNKPNMILGFVFMVITPIALTKLINAYEIMGAAYSWLIINVIYYLVLTVVIGVKYEGLKLSLYKFMSTILIGFVMLISFEFVSVFNNDLFWVVDLIMALSFGFFILALMQVIGKKYASFNCYTHEK